MVKSQKLNKLKVKKFNPFEINIQNCVDWLSFKNNKTCKNYKNNVNNSKNTNQIKYQN